MNVCVIVSIKCLTLFKIQDILTLIEKKNVFPFFNVCNHSNHGDYEALLCPCVWSLTNGIVPNQVLLSVFFQMVPWFNLVLWLLV